jgi:hypothetical protein
MTREEEIQQAASKICKDERFEESYNPVECFIAGASFADTHPINQWHDLRKNPDDLPTKNGYDWVLTMFKDSRDGFIGLPHIAEIRKDGLWHTTDDDDWVSTKEVLGDAIAWMPIPKFKGK